jgi:hypothetical protein
LPNRPPGIKASSVVFDFPNSVNFNFNFKKLGGKNKFKKKISNNPHGTELNHQPSAISVHGNIWVVQHGIVEHLFVAGGGLKSS